MTRTPVREHIYAAAVRAGSACRALVNALPRLVFSLPLPLALVGLILSVFTNAWLLGLALVLLAYLGSFLVAQASLRLRVRRIEARIRRLERLLDAAPGRPEPIPAVRAAMRWADSTLQQNTQPTPDARPVPVD